jgi:pyruvate, orthophosphate dikinase
VTAAQLSVVAFDDPLPGGTNAPLVLGGKAAGLAVMARDLGLPVPPGFVVTTEVCREFLAGGWRRELEDEIREQLDRLGERTGRRFGDPGRPLLVSVRSGAPVSMPGMMDTLLNVGMTPAIREKLAAESGDQVFAADTWLRFNRGYAEVVLEVPRDDLADCSVHDGSAAGLLLAAENVRALAANHGGIPEEPFDQLLGAIKRVFGSWDGDRARVFREKEKIPFELGTAATVQAMVFGNLDELSGSGVAFTRHPSTGDAMPCGDYLPRAQGEDVVAGTHRVQGLDALAAQAPAAYRDLVEMLTRLEQHYRDMCDIEFTVSSGTLYMLQARVGRRSPLAAVRMAVAMAEDEAFPLTREEAVARVGEQTLRQLANVGTVQHGAEPIARGLAASPGVGVGALCLDTDRAAELGAAGVAVILVRPDTSPSDVHGVIAAAGLVTMHGGMVSHAAVVARGWAIPAICSLAGAEIVESGLRIDGSVIGEGTTVTVDGSTGTLYLGDQREASGDDIPEVQVLRRWAAELEPAAIPAAPAGGGEVSAFEALRVIQLKGLCTHERIGQVLGANEVDVAAALEPHAGILKATPRGLALTPDARAWLSEQLAAERACVDRAALEAAWDQFQPLNTRFKGLITGAQLSSSIDTAAPGWPELVQSISALHAEFTPVVVDIGTAAPRLAAYSSRFEAAYAAITAGDTSMVASPIKDSYHTVWFELHEELFALTGRDRATVEAAGH